MPDIYLDFMKPAVWNALVLAVVFIGVALAILRLMKDRAAYDIKQRRQAMRNDTPPGLPSDSSPESPPASPAPGQRPVVSRPQTHRPKRRKRS